MFCSPKLIFGGTEGVGSYFQVLPARTNFRRYRGRRFLFSCIALQDSFSAVQWASGTVFMFCVPVLVFGCTECVGSVLMSCAPGLVFDGTKGVGSRFHVLCSRTYFRRYRGLQVPFSCFARPLSFSAVPRVLGLVFMFCTPELIFGSTEGVRSRFHVLRSRTHFRRYRGRQVPFSCFKLPDSFSAVPRALGPVFMFSEP
jgi:hypothetical protein